MTYLIQQTLIHSVPLMLVALGGVFAERSGVINLALEGIMIIGAFAGVLFCDLFMKLDVVVLAWQNHQIVSLQLLCLAAMLAAALIGALFSLLLSFAAVNMKADQTISGTALNLLSPAVVLFLINMITGESVLGLSMGDSASWFMIKKTMFGYDRTADLGFFRNTFCNKVYLADYICILIFIALSVLLYTTKFGLRMRACGENPNAANSLGINVRKMRYAGTTISGALAGMGGFVYALTVTNSNADGTVAGFGFLALAVMIFGNWKPLPIAAASVLFGMLKCIAAGYSSIDLNGDGVFLLRELGLGSHIYRMLPYLITLVVLAFTSKNSQAPKAEGQPFEVGRR